MLIQSRIDKAGVGEPAGSTIAYSYDGMDRLTSAVEKTSSGATNASWTYTYDKAGNRLTQVTAGATDSTKTASTASATTSWAYNNANEITSRNGSSTGWAYDADGNQTASAGALTSSATYDERNALTGATPAGSSSAEPFSYAGNGNSDRLYAGTLSFLQGPLGTAAYYDTNTNTNPNGNGIAVRHTPDGGLFSLELPDGTSRFFLTDIQGSVVTVTNANSTTATYSYDPYGQTRSLSGTNTEAQDNPYRYDSTYQDTTGLYRFSARYYDPAQGRLTQQDPSGQEMNLYAYAGDSPSSGADPTGLNTELLGGGEGAGGDGEGDGAAYAAGLSDEAGSVGASTEKNGDAYYDASEWGSPIKAFNKLTESDLELSELAAAHSGGPEAGDPSAEQNYEAILYGEPTWVTGSADASARTVQFKYGRVIVWINTTQPGKSTSFFE